jgi:hypothetical protein
MHAFIHSPVQFDSIAFNVLQTIDLNARSILDAFEAFSLSVASLATAWPLVTVPNWAAQSTQLASQTGSHQVGFLPKVAMSDRAAWEAYSVLNFDSILPAEFIWRNTSKTDATPVREDQSSPSYYFPIWQTKTVLEAPAAGNNMRIFDMINRNGLDMDYFERAMDAVFARSAPIQTEVLYTVTITKEDDASEEGTITEETPVTALVTPIMESTTTTMAGTPEIVGVMVGWLEWQYEFSNLLPEGINGIVLVVRTEKNCQKPLSFEINGPTATYLGQGDLHDSEFDSMVVESIFDTWAAVDHCGHYTFSIYPSSQYEDTHKGIRPWIYSGIALMIFAMAGVIFILYDWTVERNTERIEQRAARTDAIVNSLFPANVRDRLMRGDDKSEDGDHHSPEFPGTEQALGNSRSNSRSGLQGSGTNQFGDLRQDEAGVFTTRPIADLFPEATVMFADIVGFTAWSSTREPSQVFTLLETVYNAFDKIANRRRVFKVETIGDCYVAVAGLPEPRRDHAVCMARFAHDCLVRIKEVVQRLERRLGPDTAELSMRFGLHRYVHSLFGDGTFNFPLLHDPNKRSFIRQFPLLHSEFYRQWPCYGWCFARRKVSLPALWRYRQHGLSYRVDW